MDCLFFLHSHQVAIASASIVPSSSSSFSTYPSQPLSEVCVLSNLYFRFESLGNLVACLEVFCGKIICSLEFLFHCSFTNCMFCNSSLLFNAARIGEGNGDHESVSRQKLGQAIIIFKSSVFFY